MSIGVYRLLFPDPKKTSDLQDPANAEAGFVEGLTPQNLGHSAKRLEVTWWDGKVFPVGFIIFLVVFTPKIGKMPSHFDFRIFFKRVGSTTSPIFCLWKSPRFFYRGFQRFGAFCEFLLVDFWGIRLYVKRPFQIEMMGGFSHSKWSTCFMVNVYERGNKPSCLRGFIGLQILGWKSVVLVLIVFVVWRHRRNSIA